MTHLASSFLARGRDLDRLAEDVFLIQKGMQTLRADSGGDD